MKNILDERAERDGGGQKGTEKEKERERTRKGAEKRRN
jgi:hypothetical protein